MSGNVVQPAGNYYDKYNTRNPVARALMQGFLRSFMELAALAKPVGSALEVGCGEGELSMRLARTGWDVQGCDIAEEAVIEAQRRSAAAGLPIPFRALDVFNARGIYEPSDLVVCCEVMEHLEDPEAALEILKSLSRRHLLLSVPREPVWRALNLARGRYWKDLGNTPGHIQHWSRGAFLALIERHLEVVAVRSPLPWTLVLGRVKGC
ncbi:class I SAM-dependent methyltransferase [Frateuria hangzhouensis]|uniref:class I SAM-dependent methyltransferase n=1 Tax=Frateuria hangzhouensis TaxID=2995589 RepID=UPI002260FAA5|nr:methyltransferase domain-containing protein [Frateuria sp. STR12]MCX7512891.1 methyltransferase domain-containing protein [Frateuria sp. STR12]